MDLKYKVGDKVRIKGTDIGGIIKEIKRGQYIVQISHSSQIIVAWPENLSLIEGLVGEETLILNGKELITALGDIKLPTGKVEIWDLPEGYEFRDENGNVINATKIFLEKKPKYPQSYDECCVIMGFSFKWDNPFCINKDTHPYIKNLDNLMEGLCKLRICRDAYWKIAGEEMGLGKPWEPDWNAPNKIYYTIIAKGNEIYKSQAHKFNEIFAFPTEEMRNAFYENFNELIESVKELL